MQNVSAIPNLDKKYKNLKFAEHDGKKSCVLFFFCANAQTEVASIFLYGVDEGNLLVSYPNISRLQRRIFNLGPEFCMNSIIEVRKWHFQYRVDIVC